MSSRDTFCLDRVLSVTRSAVGRTAAWLAFVFCIGLASPQTAQAAAYATGGTGQYRNEILWLTWGGGVNGTPNQTLADGNTSTANITLATGIDLAVTCTLSNIAGNTLRSYRPGGFAGDPLDDLYNIGGTGTASALISGVLVPTGAAATFSIACTATVAGQAYRIPGLVMADAESLSAGGTVAAPTESLQATASGDWNLVEMNRLAGQTYYARLTQVNATTQTIRFGPGGQLAGSTSPGALSFLTFNSAAYTGANQQISMDFLIDGGGQTAIAIGLLVPNADFGDAPASYGTPIHLIDSLTSSPDALAANATSVDINPTAFALGALTPPTGNLIGTNGPDTELTTPFSANANGDDSFGIGGANEENGWPASVGVPLSQVGSTLSQSVSCAGTGIVAGWIDFDRSGTFDADERAQANCSGGNAALSWTVNLDLQLGTSYVRLRYVTTANAAQILLPTGRADSGEVEDRVIQITGTVNLTLTKTNTPGVNGNVDQPADTVVAGTTSNIYTLVVGNTGPDPANNTVLRDPLPSGQTCTAVTCGSETGGAVCPAVTVAALQSPAGVTIATLPANSTLTFTLTCTVP